jgi:hypothetical protein
MKIKKIKRTWMRMKIEIEMKMEINKMSTSKSKR